MGPVPVKMTTDFILGLLLLTSRAQYIEVRSGDAQCDLEIVRQADRRDTPHPRFVRKHLLEESMGHSHAAEDGSPAREDLDRGIRIDVLQSEDIEAAAKQLLDDIPARTFDRFRHLLFGLVQ